MSASLRAGRRSVEITHPDKLLFPSAGLSKLDLARHYERVAPVMLPHVRDRPLTMHAFPAGVEAEGHYVKNAPRHFPDWIRQVTVRKHGGTVDHVLANDAATLVYLAGQNVVTLHVWPSRADRIERPDRLVVDLDPATRRFAEVRAAARALGDLMRDLGLHPHAMTTGSRGLHVVAPIRREADFDEVRELARGLARRLVEGDPRHLTTEHRKEKRGERIYVDVGRNAYGQHAVAPYAVRARPTAPVAVPLRWEELESRSLKPDGWPIETMPERLAEGDPWEGIERRAASPRQAAKRLATND